MLLTLGMMAYAGANSYLKDRQQNKMRRRINDTIGDIEGQRGKLAHQNRAAYSNAIAFMAGNKQNPNAWNFASSTYNQTVGANTQRDSQYSQQITQLKSQRPDHVGTGEMFTNAGVEMGKSGLMSYMMGDFGSFGKTGEVAGKAAASAKGFDVGKSMLAAAKRGIGGQFGAVGTTIGSKWATPAKVDPEAIDTERSHYMRDIDAPYAYNEWLFGNLSGPDRRMYRSSGMYNSILNNYKRSW